MKTIEVTCEECRKTFEMDEEKFDRLSLNEQGVRIIHEGRAPLFCSNKCGELWMLRMRNPAQHL